MRALRYAAISSFDEVATDAGAMSTLPATADWDALLRYAFLCEQETWSRVDKDAPVDRVLKQMQAMLERFAQQVPSGAPRFQVDPFWPRLPKQWIFGQVSGVAVGPQDHVWVLQRPWSLNSDEMAKNPEAECCRAAPPVMEFDSAGNYLRGWGGTPSDGSYEWPMDEHGIHVDYKGNVWVSSAGGPRMAERKENFLLKFTRDGRFLLQIGRRGQSKGSLDTANLNNAADMWVHPATNEVLCAWPRP